jgi:hypothetical protein
MSVIFTIHQIFGERVLPLLIVLAAIYLTVTWKPDAPPNVVARLFPPLVGLQVLLGIIYWLYLLIGGNTLMLSFPFILHPLIGILAAGFTQTVDKGGPSAGSAAGHHWRRCWYCWCW